MFKRIASIAFFALAASLSAAATTLDSLLVVLDREVLHSEHYIALHRSRIDSLRQLRPMSDELELRIAREYQYFQSDSARTWYMRLTKAEEPIRTQAYIGLVQLNSSIGKPTDGIALIPQVTSVPSDSLRVEWLEALWKLYREAAAWTTIPRQQSEWNATAAIYYASLLVAMRACASSYPSIRLRYNILMAKDAHDWDRALAINDTMMLRAGEWTHPYAILAYDRAMLYDSKGIGVQRIQWLIRSAIADVRCGITDNGSSWMVADECDKAGDLDYAYDFINYSLTNASFFNAPTRFIQTYTLGHVINNQYDKRLHRYYVTLIAVISALIVLLTILAFSITYTISQYRKLSTINEQLSIANSQLQAANQVKEQYICRYLEVYSDYIRRLTTMARRAGEKDPTAFMDREMENFYRSFDDTFLSLYGTFVEDFNALLKPEARITPKPGERMTVEMRIFALILLGIDSSAKIAQLLCYSPNTISNYRVKIKNNALGSRDDFEHRIRSLAAKY